jgi:sphingosine-1-phosphate phosphatase 1
MEAAAVVGLGTGAGAGLTRWQAAALAAVAGWVCAASFFDLTRRTRALVQPWVTRRVHAETAAILRLQVRPSPPRQSLLSHLLLYGHVISTHF